MRLMQLLSDNKTDFTKLNSILALYFPIQNDYWNLCVEQVTSELSVLDGYVIHFLKIDAMNLRVAFILRTIHTTTCH